MTAAETEEPQQRAIMAAAASAWKLTSSRCPLSTSDSKSFTLALTIVPSSRVAVAISDNQQIKDKVYVSESRRHNERKATEASGNRICRGVSGQGSGVGGPGLRPDPGFIEAENVPVPPGRALKQPLKLKRC